MGGVENSSGVAARQASLLSLLVCCTVMRFEEADSSGVTGRQEKQLFLQETSGAGRFALPLLLGFPAADAQGWQDPLAATWLAKTARVPSL